MKQLIWNRRAIVSGVAVCAVAIAGACADTPPTEPRADETDISALFGGAPQDPTSFGGTLDAHFVRIAQEIPGFAGFYYDEAGTLNVVMSDGAQPLAQAEVRSRVATALQAIGHDPAAAQGAVIRQGRYDFSQLDAMHQRVSSVLGLQGTVFTDADERRNRVVIGVENAAAAASVERAVAMLGLPAEAVIIELTGPITLDSNHTLRDMVRPVAGGLSINFLRGASGFLCTHGFNVRSPNRPNVHGFVTNSHCSDTRSVVLNTPYWQHSRFVEGTFIGNEVHDLPLFTGPPCPEGRHCRYSDALGARYAPGVENAFGAIYRTIAQSPLPGDTIWTIDPVNPRWQIVDEIPFPVLGQTLHKTGRRTGWTSGPVTATCVNSNVGGSDPPTTMLCQDRVDTPSGGGDSGSPYFVRIGETNNVALIGIHWGSGGTPPTTVMSAMSNIRHENTNPHGWITFPGQSPPPPPPPR
jgi:hypothetical protein